MTSVEAPAVSLVQCGRAPILPLDFPGIEDYFILFIYMTRVL